MTMMGSVASLLLKKASQRKKLAHLLKESYLYFGAFLYLSSALINIYLLRIFPYSIVLPLTAITYIWTLLVSFWFLNEKITFRKVFGVVCIIIGSITITQ
jgi:drug/metabolite transporter (DMT)-like permease